MWLTYIENEKCKFLQDNACQVAEQQPENPELSVSEPTPEPSL